MGYLTKPTTVNRDNINKRLVQYAIRISKVNDGVRTWADVREANRVVFLLVAHLGRIEQADGTSVVEVLV